MKKAIALMVICALALVGIGMGENSAQAAAIQIMFLPEDPRAAYLSDLGMTVPESVKKMAEETDSFAIALSAENADLLYDIDLIIAYGSPALLEALQADPLLGTIPAIANGAVALIEDGTPLAASATPSALSIPATLDDYLRIIGEAADKVK